MAKRYRHDGTLTGAMTAANRLADEVCAPAYIVAGAYGYRIAEPHYSFPSHSTATIIEVSRGMARKWNRHIAGDSMDWIPGEWKNTFANQTQ